MTTDNADIVHELRLLANTVLERVQPGLKLLAGSSPRAAEFVRTLESVARGEQKSDLAAQAAAHAPKIIAQLRGFIEDSAPTGSETEGDPPAPTTHAQSRPSEPTAEATRESDSTAGS